MCYLTCCTKTNFITIFESWWSSLQFLKARLFITVFHCFLSRNSIAWGFWMLLPLSTLYQRITRNLTPLWGGMVKTNFAWDFWWHPKSLANQDVPKKTPMWIDSLDPAGSPNHPKTNTGFSSPTTPKIQQHWKHRRNCWISSNRGW